MAYCMAPEHGDEVLLFYFRSPGESLNQRDDSTACLSIAPHLYFTGQSFDSVGQQEVKYCVPAIRMKVKCQQCFFFFFSGDKNRTSTGKEVVGIIIHCKKKVQMDNNAGLNFSMFFLSCFFA